jgi:hypothetical protein
MAAKNGHTLYQTPNAPCRAGARFFPLRPRFPHTSSCPNSLLRKGALRMGSGDGSLKSKHEITARKCAFH